MASDLPAQALSPPPPLPPSPGAAANEAPLLGEAELSRALHHLEAFLSVLGFHQSSSPAGLLLSCSAFVLLGIATPLAALYLSRCSSGDGCEGYRSDQFELSVYVSEAALAAASLGCVSRNLFKYGMRRFLFVDQHHGHVERFQKEYVSKIQDFFCLLLRWILPCFVVQTAREAVRFAYAYHNSAWKAAVVFFASVLSWMYLTTIILSACFLFYLVCNLQVIHFEDYAKLLERDTDTLIFLEEHVRLRFYLSKISHRFRIYLLLLFLFVTASQFVTLTETTAYTGVVSFANAGRLAVSSVLQVVVIVLCLNGAAKISHRAQGIGSVASRWHAMITCTSADSSQSGALNGSGMEAVPIGALLADYSESDLESFDNVSLHANTQLVSYMSSYHKRQALVMYLQSNPGGITVFGWTVDRTLINTIFFLELTLALFVLSKTLVFK